MLICRACLSVPKKMVEIDEELRFFYYSLTDINVSSSDGLPQHFCWDCYEIIQNYIHFKDKCTESEAHLLLNLQNNICKEENEEKYIKSEVECFEDSSTHFDDFVEDNSSIAIKHINSEGVLADIALCDIKIEIKRNEETNTGKQKQQKKISKHKKISKKKQIKLSMKNQDKVLKKNQKKLSEKTITTAKNVKEHLLCGLCPESFESNVLLNMHIENHKKDKKCRLCMEEMACWPYLLAHRMVHTGKDGCCHICGKRYHTYISLEQHYMLNHYDGEIIKPTCKLCLKTYATTLKLRKHMRYAHSENVFICDTCNKRFKSKNILRSHIKSHSNLKPYECDMCDFKCKYRGGLKLHKLWVHAPTKYMCSNCHCPYESEWKLNEHEERCKNKDTVCMHCGKIFKKLCSYRRHMKNVHTPESRYKCARCPATFKHRAPYRVHCDRHDGHRRRQCEYCPAAFYSSSVLIKHRRTHTGEKPYVCKICQKGFTGNNNLKVHMRVHGLLLINKKNKDVIDDE